MRRLVLFASLGVLGLAGGCTQAECENPDYTQAECRVVVENELARIRTREGLEVRFQPAKAKTAASWDATGLLRLGEDRLESRVAGLGDFAISVTRPDTQASPIQLRLRNVNPLARITVEGGGNPVDLGLAGETVVDLEAYFQGDDEDLWIRGEVLCPSSYKIAVLGDIQTNPFQFERIVERLAEDAAEDPVSKPLMGLVVLGDLTELSEDAEFEAVDQLFDRLPVPVAVTPGNHDVFKSARAIYNRTFGPGNHVFDVCGTRIALLDTGNGALAPSVEGRLPDLLDGAGSQNLIIGTHYPAYPGLTGNGWSREDQAQHLLVEAVNQRADLLVAGHVHALLDFPDIPVAGASLREIITGTGGADQGAGLARYGYLRLDVDAALEIHTCFVEVPPPGTGGTNPPLPGVPACD